MVVLRWLYKRKVNRAGAREKCRILSVAHPRELETLRLFSTGNNRPRLTPDGHSKFRLRSTLRTTLFRDSRKTKSSLNCRQCLFPDACSIKSVSSREIMPNWLNLSTFLFSHLRVKWVGAWTARSQVEPRREGSRCRSHQHISLRHTMRLWDSTASLLSLQARMQFEHNVIKVSNKISGMELALHRLSLTRKRTAGCGNKACIIRWRLGQNLRRAVMLAMGRLQNAKHCVFLNISDL